VAKEHTNATINARQNPWRCSNRMYLKSNYCSTNGTAIP
jgi:hypothetical protein